MKHTQESFLLNTLEYYTEDVNRRCKSNGGGCYYSPQRAGKEGISDGCAIGRHIETSLKDALDQKLRDFDDTGIKTIFSAGYKNYLPTWMQEMNVTFLNEIQNFHDTDVFWSLDGISTTGEEQLENILKEFNINKEPFTKYLN